MYNDKYLYKRILFVIIKPCQTSQFPSIVKFELKSDFSIQIPREIPHKEIFKLLMVLEKLYPTKDIVYVAYDSDSHCQQHPHREQPNSNQLRNFNFCTAYR